MFSSKDRINEYYQPHDILIINGRGVDTNFSLPTTVINPDNFATSSAVGSYNVIGYWGTGGLITNVPVYCGGVYDGTIVKGCYKMNEEYPFAELSTAKYGSSSVVYQNRLLVMGGFHTDTTDFISLEDGGKSNPGPKMPFTLLNGCASLLSNDRVLIAGGNQYGHAAGGASDKTHFYDFISEEWTQGPTMAKKRQHFSCHTIEGGLTMVTGGWPWLDDVEVLESTESPSQWVLSNTCILPFQLKAFLFARISNLL